MYAEGRHRISLALLLIAYVALLAVLVVGVAAGFVLAFTATT